MRTPVTILFGALLLAAGCTHTVTKADVAQAKREVKFAKRDLASANKSIEPLSAYVADLERGAFQEGFFLMLSPKDLLAAGTKAFIPYSFPAQSIHNKISGTLTTKKILEMEVLPSNKLRMVLLVQGKNIKVHYKGSMYKPHIKKIKAALQKGMKAEMVVNLSLSKSGSVVARARCRDVQLLAHNDSMYRSNIKGAINKTVGKKKYQLPLQKQPGLEPAEVLTTEHHVIVRYR
jgi:hypothetical protein